MTQASAGATHWSKPSENRFCERSAKAIGLLEALVERQLAWASRGHRWHTRWISWGSLARQSEQFSPVFQKSDPRENRGCDCATGDRDEVLHLTHTRLHI